MTASSQSTGAGIGRYGVSLACALSAHPESVDLTLAIRYGPRGRRKSLRAQMAATGWSGAELPFISRWGWLTPPPQGDMFHAVGTRVPRRRPGKRIATFHDLSSLDQPEYADPRENELQVRRLVRAAHVSDAIIVPSEFTASRIHHHFPRVSKERISVILHGITLPDSDSDDVRAFRTRHGLRQQYVLQVGVQIRRKNLPLLLQSFAASKPASEWDLVMVGETTSHTRDLLELADRLGISNRVRMLGRLSDASLAAAYRGALAYVQPSLYEGFGLTLAEAMAAGVPCIVADSGSLREVAGETVLYPDELSVPCWASVFNDLEVDIQGRDERAKAALERSKAFTWQATAQATIDLYRRLAISS